ncbi:hypothetical protein EJ05DRAFT_517676 [Pseudovirgaria hyperparasitica]|uniref:Uncharacterized protein n=1 Tax=Pseudovirgaria hyperparasitica TaxID=470096 RepID=A0A6A6W3T8_9PEZI|nr:uncharacterized protein EJ05DRAFT_517676 [Pseudovirgaria hyperparasitica]KAF2757225.1 hypothetical protein EJ05DRAFT_517676 [Pseudovirgaria hyperparasitica]
MERAKAGKRTSDLASGGEAKRHRSKKHSPGSSSEPPKKRKKQTSLSSHQHQEDEQEEYPQKGIKIEDYSTKADKQIRSRFLTLNELDCNSAVYKDAVKGIVEICLPSSEPAIQKLKEIVAEYKAYGARKDKRAEFKKQLKPAMLKRLGEFVVEDCKNSTEAALCAEVLGHVILKASTKFGDKIKDMLRDALRPTPIEISSGDEDMDESDDDVQLVEAARPVQAFSKSDGCAVSVEAESQQVEGAPGSVGITVGSSRPPTALPPSSDTGRKRPSLEATKRDACPKVLVTPLFDLLCRSNADFGKVIHDMRPPVYSHLLSAIRKRLTMFSCCTKLIINDAIPDMMAMIEDLNLNSYISAYVNQQDRHNAVVESLERMLELYVRRHPRLFPDVDWRLNGLLVLGLLRENSQELKALFPTCADRFEPLIYQIRMALLDRTRAKVPDSAALLVQTNGDYLTRSPGWNMNISDSCTGLESDLRSKFEASRTMKCNMADIEFLIEDTLEAFALYEPRAFPEFSKAQWDVIKKRQSAS